MLAFQWNALRVGDRVRVHDDQTTDLTLRDGVVALVQTHEGELHDVGVRQGVDSSIVHPRRQAVHLEDDDGSDVCWRCATPAGVAT